MGSGLRHKLTNSLTHHAHSTRGGVTIYRCLHFTTTTLPPLVCRGAPSRKKRRDGRPHRVYEILLPQARSATISTGRLNIVHKVLLHASTMTITRRFQGRESTKVGRLGNNLRSKSWSNKLRILARFAMLLIATSAPIYRIGFYSSARIQ